MLAHGSSSFASAWVARAEVSSIYFRSRHSAFRPKPHKRGQPILAFLKRKRSGGKEINKTQV